MQLLRNYKKKIRKLDEQRGERICRKQGHGNENRGDQDRGGQYGPNEGRGDQDRGDQDHCV